MDENFVDRNKYKGKNIENKTDKITERPVDDTIEEKYKEIHRSFLKVMTETVDKIQDGPNIITEAMEHMHQGGR